MPDETVRWIQSRGGEAFGHAGNVVEEPIIETFVRTVDGGWTADGGWDSLRRGHRES